MTKMKCITSLMCYLGLHEKQKNKVFGGKEEIASCVKTLSKYEGF